MACKNPCHALSHSSRPRRRPLRPFRSRRPPAPTTVRIGECGIAPSPHSTSCDPQQCQWSGGWCVFETISGQCSQHVLKVDEHGAAEPVRQRWVRGHSKGFPTLCGGCLCRRLHPEPRPQRLPVSTGNAMRQDMLNGMFMGRTGE